MVQQHAATGLQQVLINQRRDVDIVLRARCAADDCMVVTNNLIKRANLRRTAAQIVDVIPFLLLFFIYWPEVL